MDATPPHPSAILSAVGTPGAAAGGVPPPSNEAFTTFFKGFLAGAFLASLSKRLILGAIVGVASGAFYQQEYGAPSVKEQVDKWKASFAEMAKNAAPKK